MPALDTPPSLMDRERITTVRRIIRPYVRQTPVLHTPAADFGLDPSVSISLKLEQLQHTGSFKVRGAFANLLTQEVPSVGVVAASGGNHGAAVAFAAMRLGLPARIFIPTVASPVKVRQIRDYGAELVIEGERYADALAASERWVAASGALPVHAYDQLGTLLGTGTLGAELEEQIPDVDTLLIAVGGGGLIGGTAAWFGGCEGKKVRIIGVEPELAPTLTKALAAGRPVDADAGGIAADSLAPRRVGELTFALAQRHLDRVLLVSDQVIRHAQQALWRVARVVAEPGGAAAFGALLSGGYQPRPDERVGIVVCGGNTTAVDFDR
jgi:threonine dehydratase